ncbi:hypothetical protein DRJ48_01700 [Candidatus Woesearchaeota archaeon]|nr:MAG: hypothetical protein DRJ48_01700 [Candidatus Woesearchaeota archaeon]
MSNFEDGFGEIEVYPRPMFGGKTEDLIHRAQEAERLGFSVAAYKHILDQRYPFRGLVSHSKMQYDAKPLETAWDIFKDVKEENPDVVLIEEAQLFDRCIVDLIYYLFRRGKNVAVAYLPHTFDREWFKFPDYGDVSEITTLGTSGDIKPKSHCSYIYENGSACTRMATLTQRIIDNKPAPYNAERILIGAEESYRPVCLAHHDVPGREEHLAVLDVVRILNSFNILSHGVTGVALDKVAGFNSFRADEIKGFYADLFKELAWELENVRGGDKEKKELENRLRMVRFALSYLNFFEEPEMGRRELFTLEGLEKKLSVLERNGKLVMVGNVIKPV